jgi:long-chain acyl-CoA synthetase
MRRLGVSHRALVTSARQAADTSVAELPRTRTIPLLWRNGVAQQRAWPAYLVEQDGGWTAVSWAEAGRRVDELANGLLQLGIRKGDTFAILGSTRIEWALFDFALACVGAVTVGVYANSSPKETRHVVEHSEAVGVLFEDEQQRTKLAGTTLRHVLSFDDLEDLAARGRTYAAQHPGALDAAVAAIGEDDLFTLIYTSGTTGPPKGCMITHRNFHAMVTVVDRLPEFTQARDTVLLFLPLAHNFARLMHLGGPYIGYTIAFLDDPLRVFDALTQVRPQVFPSVPRFYEKIHAGVLQTLADTQGAKRRVGEWALRIGYDVSRLRQAGRPIPPALALRRRAADRLLHSKVRARLGGRLRIGFSGGAPLSKDVCEFFHAIGVLVLEGYGLTECTAAVTVNRPNAVRFGTVGQALPGIVLTLAEDGELLIGGQTVFAGYFKDPAATAGALDDDGRLRTGDIATIDADGFVTITDRKKDIIVTAGGKKVAPANVENQLKLSAVISQALVVGDRRPFVTALITLDPSCGLAAGSEEAHAAVQAAVQAANAELSRHEQVKRFRILARDFSADEDELTPTMKLKRRVLEQRHGAEIEQLYA